MPETFPAGVLRNTATDRFHPIVFYPSPRPSEAGESVVRHRSKGHHTAGFDTLDEAIAFINARPTWRHTRLVWAWDGEGIPALTFSFPLPDDRPKLTAPQANALRAIAASEHAYEPL